VEARESLFPLVDWTKQQAFPTQDRTYIGDPRSFYDTMGADKERVLALVEKGIRRRVEQEAEDTES
jgi:hypothetical protein